jgi:hypothetical protein
MDQTVNKFLKCSVYIALTTNLLSTQDRQSLTLHPFNMTLISNDPSLWPLIRFDRVESYFAGSWSKPVHVDSNIDLLVIGPAVASTVAVIYDWGEQDTGP